MVYILGVIIFLGVCTALGRQDQEINQLRGRLRDLERDD